MRGHEEATVELMNAEHTARVRLIEACGTIRYLRSKLAGIAYLEHGEGAAVEGLALTVQWAFLDHIEADEAAAALLSTSDPATAN